MKTQELFEKNAHFQAVRISREDAERRTDHFKVLRELVLENEQMYPNIKKWFDQKVVNGIAKEERIGYVAYLDGKPAVSAIVKRGESAKFCHLKIKQELQDIHLGEAFFALMGLETRGCAREVHFTLPESVWENEKAFFKSFGFSKAVKSGHQYRFFEEELRCSSPFSKVWNAILEKLPKLARAFSVDGYSMNNSVLMSMRPEYAQRILNGEKQVEIRRRFSKKWVGERVSLYASAPVKCLVGEAVIANVVVGTPDEVWEKFGLQIGCKKEDFVRYSECATEVYAIIFDGVQPYKRNVPLKEVSGLTNKRLRPPQSYYSLSGNKDWAKAVSMGALLQTKFEPSHVITL